MMLFVNDHAHPLSELIDDIPECGVLNLSIALERLAAFHMPAHFSYEVRVLYLEIRIAYESAPCQMAAGNLIDGSELILSGQRIPHLDIPCHSGQFENHLDGIVVFLG